MILNGLMFRDIVISAANALDNEKDAINRLNVFPVPDGDTGVNMSLTMAAVRSDLPRFQGTVGECADKVANMLLRGARGNSGVILSLFFRGLSKEFKGQAEVDAPQIARAFKRGVDAAYKAVMKPTEGTILTVMRVCAEQAVEHADAYQGDVEGLLAFALTVAEGTLEKTPDMLPVLKQANLVDAGGRGFVVILSGMVSALQGQPVEAVQSNGIQTAEQADFGAFQTEDIVYPYCTECIVTKERTYIGEGKTEALHQFVLGAGDSAVFVDDTEIVKIHVHTSDPGRVLSEALKYGSLLTVKVENMREQHTTLASEAELQPESLESRSPEKKYGFVSVANGDGICAVFRDLGADELVIGGQTMNPSTEDMLRAIRMTPAENVIVLPNNSNIYLVAKQAAELVEDKHVEVLRSVSVPQGINAMLAFNPDADPAENVMNMREAMTAVSSLSMTFAAHDSTFDGKEIRQGQILGLVENKVTHITDTREECMRRLAEGLHETSFVTLFYGEGISEDEANHFSEILRDVLGSDTEIMVINGGQPVYYYVISAE